MKLLEELKRRNVFRVGLAYLVSIWLVLQVADLVLDSIRAPNWVMQLLLLSAAIGFPVALLFSWAFEVTPEGVKREHDVDRSKSVSAKAGRKLNFLITVMLAIAVVYFVADKWLLHENSTTGRSPVAGLEKSIAVLPFSNRSSVDEDAHFVDGIHDDILTGLAKLSGLDKVTSRTSAEQYRNTDKSILQIGQELGVATILEGGVQRAGNRVRINMQLINVKTDAHLWAETYERELTIESLFEIQSDITRKIVTALQAALTKNDEEQLASLPTTNLEAYDQFVLGRQEMTQRTAKSLAAALAYFEKAIELDANYALAYVGVADTLALQTVYSGQVQKESFKPRQDAIDKALRLDPRSGEAYAALGQLRREQENGEAAEAAFLRAIELSPNYATAYHWYSNFLGTDDRHEESLQQLRKALSLDPLASVLVSNLVDSLRLFGRIEEAKATLLDGIRRNPEFPSFYADMAGLLHAQGRLGESAAWLDRAIELNRSNVGFRLALCNIFVDLIEVDGAEDCLATLRADFPQFPESVFAYTKTGILMVTGETEAAVEYAEFVAAAEPSAQWILIEVYLSSSEWRKAQPILESLGPKFYADGEIVVSPSELVLAIQVASSLRDGDGFTERAHYLAGQALKTMSAMHRTRGIGYYFFDVPAHAARGDIRLAIDALRDAIDSGWRARWWSLRLPAYDPLVIDLQWGSKWNALISELEADIAVQRQWYEEHKNDPLF